jgi:hypothetical protein
MMSRLILPALLLGWLLPNLLWAHPSDEWVGPTRVLGLWADAVNAQNDELVAELTGSNVPRYRTSSDTLVTINHATYRQVGDSVEAAPLLISSFGGSYLTAWKTTLARENGQWRVQKLEPMELPASLAPTGLSEQVPTKPVRFRVASENKPAYARVNISDSDGNYWPPRGHQKNIRAGWRQDVGGDVLINGKTYAYVAPEFFADLPQGSYTIEVRKGTEFYPTIDQFEVTGKHDSVDVEMNRWTNLAASGWYAGDTHTHFLSEGNALEELRAEDLNVIYVLATKWGELITDVANFHGKPSPHGAEGEIVVYNEEARHSWLGHTILHGIDELVYPLAWGSPPEGVVDGSDYPPMAAQADAAHAQSGMVTWAHFPFPGGELAVDIGLGKVDTIDLFTWGDAFNTGALDMYYRFLNTGSRLPATAGTDKMLNVQVVGSVRTYANVEGPLTYERWLAALAAGKTFVTTGPVLKLTVNDAPIGAVLEASSGESVSIRAEVHAPYPQYPVEKLEIVQAGEVIASVANKSNDSHLTLEADVTIEGSTWIAARTNGTELLPMQVWSVLGAAGVPPMAHTSPVYIDVAAKPIWDETAAAALVASVDTAIEWALTEAKFETREQRQEVVALFRKARAKYAQTPVFTSE